MNDEKVICHQCISEKYVKGHIISNGTAELNCSYCHRKRKNIALTEVAEMMHSVFSHHYDLPEIDAFYEERGGDAAQEVIAIELGVDEEVSDDIYGLLCEEYNPYNDYEPILYNDDFIYKRRGYSSQSLDYQWEKMKDSLMQQARFFNRPVKEFLDGLFSDLSDFLTEDKKSPVKMLETHIPLYRSRVFESMSEVVNALTQPERNFGPPPSELARPGRMNASGISVFYGATTESVSIAEVRPPVGSYVVVAPFKPVRPLRVLDISSLDLLRFSTESIFNPATRLAQERTAFLKTFSRKLTLPVFGKNQDNEYLITQAIAEYLGVSEKHQLDGISFRSTQVKKTSRRRAETGYNVVLFSKSSTVKYADFTTRKYNVETMENIEDDVYMFHPTIRLIEDGKRYAPGVFMFSSSRNTHTLELQTEGLTFFEIEGVEFQKKGTGIAQGKPLIRKPDNIDDEFTDF